MNFRFQCPDCGRLLEVQQTHCGKEAKCTACGNIITVPLPQHKRNVKKYLFLILTAVFVLLSALAVKIAYRKKLGKTEAPAAAQAESKKVAKTETAPQKTPVKYPFTVMHNSGVPRIKKTFDGLQQKRVLAYSYRLRQAIINNNAWAVSFFLERNIVKAVKDQNLSASCDFQSYKDIVIRTARHEYKSITVLAFLLENSETFGMKINEWNEVYDILLERFSNNKYDYSYMLPLFGYFASHGITGGKQTEHLLNIRDFPLKEQLLFVRQTPPEIDTTSDIIQKLPKTKNKTELVSAIPAIKNAPAEKIYDGTEWEKIFKTFHGRYPMGNFSKEECIAYCEKIRKAVNSGFDVNDLELELIFHCSNQRESTIPLICFLMENGVDPRVTDEYHLTLIENICNGYHAEENARAIAVYLANKGVPVTHNTVNHARSQEMYMLYMQLRAETGPHWDEHLINKNNRWYKELNMKQINKNVL